MPGRQLLEVVAGRSDPQACQSIDDLPLGLSTWGGGKGGGGGGEGFGVEGFRGLGV